MVFKKDVLKIVHDNNGLQGVKHTIAIASMCFYWIQYIRIKLNMQFIVHAFKWLRVTKRDFIRSLDPL